MEGAWLESISWYLVDTLGCWSLWAQMIWAKEPQHMVVAYTDGVPPFTTIPQHKKHFPGLHLSEPLGINWWLLLLCLPLSSLTPPPPISGHHLHLPPPPPPPHHNAPHLFRTTTRPTPVPLLLVLLHSKWSEFNFWYQQHWQCWKQCQSAGST